VYGNNFVKTMLRIGKQKKEIHVVSDQFGCPTSARDLAEAIFHMISHMDKSLWGTYHFCNKGIISWFRFAKKIFEITREFDADPTPAVLPISSDDYPTEAKRPMHSALNCDKIIACFGIAPKPWEESLQATIQRIMNQKSSYETDK
jgi:dTDP-4-dehydrorhamnose reductase